MPQSLYYSQKDFEQIYCKFKWFFKAQIVPVSTELVSDAYGKSMLRDR